MNILVLEDRGAPSFYMVEALRALGHIVLEAGSVIKARSCWDNRSVIPIHCMIVDLNMAPEGMDDRQVAQTKGGLLTGWIWLKEEVLAKYPLLRHRVILYSDYLDELRQHVSDTELDDLRLVPKRGRSGPADQVRRHVAEIAQMPLEGEPAHE